MLGDALDATEFHKHLLADAHDFAMSQVWPAQVHQDDVVVMSSSASVREQSFQGLMRTRDPWSAIHTCAIPHWRSHAQLLTDMDIRAEKLRGVE